jgi:hypothetical protein
VTLFNPPTRRALGIPARAESAYAGPAPIEGIVWISSGRDVWDIAFLTSDKQCQMIRQTIEVMEAAGD